MTISSSKQKKPRLLPTEVKSRLDSYRAKKMNDVLSLAPKQRDFYTRLAISKIDETLHEEYLDISKNDEYTRLLDSSSSEDELESLPKRTRSNAQPLVEKDANELAEVDPSVSAAPSSAPENTNELQSETVAAIEASGEAVADEVFSDVDTSQP